MVGHLEVPVHAVRLAHQTRVWTVTVGTPTSFLPFEPLTPTATSYTPHPMKTKWCHCCVFLGQENIDNRISTKECDRHSIKKPAHTHTHTHTMKKRLLKPLSHLSVSRYLQSIHKNGFCALQCMSPVCVYVCVCVQRAPRHGSGLHVWCRQQSPRSCS